MDPTSASLSLHRLGTFDEETCRYFLREVGEQIVPFYPFAVGIDEVYTLLLERYGEDWVADALSVLHELMEAHDNANGLGDDGDIWRSWRHSWRHRNVCMCTIVEKVFNSERQADPSKPFTPAVRGFVLPPPTSPSRRWARASCFSACVAAPLEANDELPGESGNLVSAGTEVDAVQPMLPDDNKRPSGRSVRFEEPSSVSHARQQGILSNDGDPGRRCSMDSDEEQADSQQDFNEVRDFADLVDSDNAQLISFEMLTPPSGPSGGNMEIRTLRPVVQNRELSPLSVKHQKRISQSTSCQVSNLSSERVSRKRQDFLMASQSDDPFLTSDKSWDMTLPSTVFEGETTGVAGIMGQATADQNAPSAHSHPDTGTGSFPSTTMSHTTVANRHARLIDGAIFTAKHRVLIDPIYRRRDKLHEEEGKSSHAVRQKEPSRHSLIQGVREIFRKDQQQQQQHEDENKGHRRRSSLLHNALDRGCDMLFPKPTVASTTSDLVNTPHVRTHTWGLDGAFDGEPGLPRLFLDLNKPLPASPGNPSVRQVSSSRTRTPSLDQSQNTPNRPSTASSVSSSISIASSKRDFRALTRGLINDEMGARRPDLTPVRELETLSPAKYDPRQSMKSSVYSENSYKGTKNNNPFTEDPVPLTPGIPLPLSVRKREGAIMLPETSEMSPSHSLAHAQAHTPSRGRAEQAVYRSPAPSRYNPDNHEVKFDADNAARGRTPHRPSSPKHEPTTDTTSQKRSRSPVKKFLGQFGKSTSLKNITGEPRSKSNSTSPEKSTSTPLKSWGNRLRHGLLTTDSDPEVSPNDVLTSSRKATPSTPPQSTFPISLGPPYQAKILSEIELMICYNANSFLMKQWKAGRLSDESIVKMKHSWTDKNRPQVLEFMYDQVTQRDLIAANLRTIRFHGECGQNPQVLNATLYNWKALATEMAVRTFCSADSAIRKYMHDAHKIIEMLGAAPNTFIALQDLQLRTLAMITEKQRERMERNREQVTPSKQPGSVGRRVGTPAPVCRHTPKSSIDLNPSPGFDQAFEAFENARGGRLGMMVRDMAQNEDQH